jgi:hypothetical protein
MCESAPAFAQDSLSTKEGRTYSTIGFQASQVSGTGISFGFNQENKFRFRVTGGILTYTDKSYFSFGTELEYELTKNRPYRVFIGPGIGTYGASTSSAHPTIGLGTGFETGMMGDGILDNVTGGVEIYYPTFFLLSSTIGFGGGFFVSYNF